MSEVSAALRIAPEPKPKARRGTTNGNARGSYTDRARRREWLVLTYRANRDLVRVAYTDGYVDLQPYDLVPERIMEFESVVLAEAVPSCRCYRCGTLLTVDTVTVDRIIPGCKGGAYRRNNVRPACGACNSETGGALASHPKRRKARVASSLSVASASVRDTNLGSTE